MRRRLAGSYSEARPAAEAGRCRCHEDGVTAAAAAAAVGAMMMALPLMPRLPLMILEHSARDFMRVAETKDKQSQIPSGWVYSRLKYFYFETGWKN